MYVTLPNQVFNGLTNFSVSVWVNSTTLNEGLLSVDEKYRKTIEIWERVQNDIEKVLSATIDKKGPVYDMLTSGARGSISNLTQMVGMKGLIINPAGRTIDFPIIPSYKEGLSPIEYFISTHGSRKGLADTALSTAKAGYLTRRLVDVAQDVVVTEEDCKTHDGLTIKAENISGVDISLSKNVRGRILASDAKTPDGKVLYKKGTLITKEEAKIMEDSGVAEVYARSPLHCKTIHGVCQACYGLDLARNTLIELGEAVGIVAAQAIGEPGTQLTLRTFHLGGVAGVDITAGLPRVEEVFERRTSIKNPAVVSKEDGEILEIKDDGKEKSIVVLGEHKGGKKGASEEYTLPFKREPVVKVGEKVVKGQLLTDGSADILEVFKYGGKEMAADYIIHEIDKVYSLQGASISRKHIEIIVRQMCSRRRITKAGDTTFSVGDIVEYAEFLQENKKITKENGEEATGDTVILGITETSLTTKSWLSAASFQNTNRTLINNAIRGGIDDLRGLKENVIIGRLIPAGTGFKKDK